MNGRHQNPSQPWEELESCLKMGKIVVAEDLIHNGREYLLLPGSIGQPESPATAEEDSGTTAVAESGGLGPVKKTKETFNLVVNERKGHGGFGVVYRVTKVHPLSKTSLEICLKQARYEAWESLVHENDIFNHLDNHPHEYIIRRDFLCKRVSDHVKDFFLGLEYFDGRTLSDIIVINCYKKLHVSHTDLHTILCQQVEAVQHLQNNGIYHCDIKPENIIYHSGRKLSKLIDFGLAVYRFGTGQRFKSQGGTTEYMAPETLVDHCLEAGSDIYGLAATLHHLITLRCPWFSLEKVQGVRAERTDKKDPNYAELSRIKRRDIRQAIKEEIVRYRGYAAELAGDESSEDPLMAVQEELKQCHTPCDPVLINIIIPMLHHTPSERPQCGDILVTLKTTTDRDKHIHRTMSQRSSTSSFSAASSSYNTSNSRPVEQPVDATYALNPQHPLPLEFTDMYSSGERQRVHPLNSAQDSNPDLPAINELMENASINDAHEFKVPRALEDIPRMSARVSHPTAEMASLSHHPSGMQPQDEYRDDVEVGVAEKEASMSLDNDYVYSSEAYSEHWSEYEPGPNQPVGGDPTGMSDYLSQHQNTRPQSSFHFSMPHSNVYQEEEEDDVLADSPNTVRPSLAAVHPPEDEAGDEDDEDEEGDEDL